MFRYSEIREENEKMAREYGKKIVDMLANGDYEGVFSIVDDFGNGWAKENLNELAETMEMDMEDNDVRISPYDTAEIPDITYKDGSKYEREYFIYYEESYDFHYDCDLLPTDLTLMLDFLYIDGMYKVVFDDIHQM